MHDRRPSVRRLAPDLLLDAAAVALLALAPPPTCGPLAAQVGEVPRLRNAL